QATLAFTTGWLCEEFLFIIPHPRVNDSVNTRYDIFVKATEVIYHTYCEFIGNSKVTKELEKVLNEARSHNLFCNQHHIAVRDKIIHLFELAQKKVRIDLLYALSGHLKIYFQIGDYLSQATYKISASTSEGKGFYAFETRDGSYAVYGTQSYLDRVVETIIDPLEELTSRTNLPNYLKENLQYFIVLIRTQEFSSTKEVFELGQNLGSSILSYLLTE
ncbi:hypothetical protein, partial [Allocoleopsis sp.]|uniref:hypothetical protein n=1 Tax=Allocoleopsis sp. TaxID=3088169 RepID=UPI002FD1BB67